MSFVIKHPQEFRERIRNHFIKILSENSLTNNTSTVDESLVNETEKISTNLEIGVYNYAIQEANRRKIIKTWDNLSFCQLYIDRMRSLYFNLKPELVIQLIKKEVKPQEVAFMTHQEFDPSQWKELIEKKAKRDDSKLNVNIESSTNLFTCKKCHSKKCTYYELQIRSADEPATIFVTCLDCGKHWRC